MSNRARLLIHEVPRPVLTPILEATGDEEDESIARSICRGSSARGRWSCRDVGGTERPGACREALMFQ
jgi:hypothetical protein